MLLATGGLAAAWRIVGVVGVQISRTDSITYFRPVDGNLFRGLDAQFHTAAVDLDDHDANVIADHDCLIGLSAKHEHEHFLLKRLILRATNHPRGALAAHTNQLRGLPCDRQRRFVAAPASCTDAALRVCTT